MTFKRPSLAAFLVRIEVPQPVELFRDLLELELKWRWLRGENFTLAEYEQRFPEFRDTVSERFSALPPEPSYVLEVVEGRHRGLVREIKGHETVLIGRAKGLQLPLTEDRHLSRHHCRLEISPPYARILDLESRNGTFVNRVRVRQHDLQSGDHIRIGKSKLVYRVLAPINVPPQPITSTIIFQPESPRAALPRHLKQPVQVHIPGYALVGEIGRGGLGQVFRARQLATGRIVAVKLILPNRAVDSATSKLFLREATIMSQLCHRRIVQFLELGLSGEQLYLVMEYVPCISFEELCVEASPERRWRMACAVIRSVLGGLAFAHARHVVHRDVKPPNILISRSELRRVDVKLADFGMAKNYLTAGFSGLTDEGAARGSLAYMSPEQILDCRAAKPACDLYATAVTLYHYITQQLPFESPSQASAIRAILEERPPRADSIATGLPKGLADVIEKAMAKRPGDRYRSAKEMGVALAPFTRR